MTKFVGVTLYIAGDFHDASYCMVCVRPLYGWATKPGPENRTHM